MYKLYTHTQSYEEFPASGFAYMEGQFLGMNHRAYKKICFLNANDAVKRRI
jgi:hypothetical protein